MLFITRARALLLGARATVTTFVLSLPLALAFVPSVSDADEMADEVLKLSHLFEIMTEGDDALRESVMPLYQTYITGARDMFTVRYQMDAGDLADEAVTSCMATTSPDVLFETLVRMGADPELADIRIAYAVARMLDAKCADLRTYTPAE